MQTLMVILLLLTMFRFTSFLVTAIGFVISTILAIGLTFLVVVFALGAIEP